MEKKYEENVIKGDELLHVDISIKKPFIKGFLSEKFFY